MSVILYARVSTQHQAEKDLSIPAQLRLLRSYADENNLKIAGVYQDVASGRSLVGRTGLLRAVEHARGDSEVDTFLVHRLDRLARNTFSYLAIKAKLKTSGVKLVSLVERVTADPLGDFLEQIMSAQAEFYSANLALEVKKGLEERLRRGQWNGPAPLGYLSVHGKILPDPARAGLIRVAFDIWNRGDVTLRQLSKLLYNESLTGRGGRQVSVSLLGHLLKNEFYIGRMVVAGKAYPGVHPPLIDQATFDRAQVVFRSKTQASNHRGIKHLSFLLPRLVVCPVCTARLVGEEHHRQTRIYRYYRCHTQGCHFLRRAGDIEDRVVAQLLEGQPLHEAAKAIRERRRAARRNRPDDQRRALHDLRTRVVEAQAEQRHLAERLSRGEIDLDAFTTALEALNVQSSLATTMMSSPSFGADADETELQRLMLNAPMILKGDDAIEKRELLRAIVSKVELNGDQVIAGFSKDWYELITPSSKTSSPIIQMPSNEKRGQQNSAM